MASKQISTENGLIIVGNSGVGKSFLANLFLNRNHFKDGFSARSVTHRSESIGCQLVDRWYRLYNIPGLIEADQELVHRNREQIHRAFEEQKGNPIVIIYVFGHQNGRIRHEDVHSFHLMNKAYQFSPDSLVMIVNGLSSDRPKNYDDQTEELLIDLVKIKPCRICFVDHLNSEDLQKREEVRQSLINVLGQVHPELHRQTKKIEIIDDEIVELHHYLKRLDLQWNEEQLNYREILDELEQTSLANERVTVLRRLFVQSKMALRQLAALIQQEEHWNSVIDQCNTEEIDYKKYSNFSHYRLSTESKENAQSELAKNLSQRRWLKVSLNNYRKDIEQTCYELKQIYRGEFDRQYEACRECFILLDDLRFDSLIADVHDDFLHHLFIFTRLHLDHFD